METGVKLFLLSELRERGSVRFPLPDPRFEGFAHRAPDGTVRAWVNLCPHRAQPVDIGDGRLFNSLGEIECHAHGARFDPSTGSCTGGPCPGTSLQPLQVHEQDGSMWLD